MERLTYEQELEAVLERRGRFGHREHLELAWRYLRIADLGTAERLMAAAIRHLASAHGTPDRYHHTMTLSWVRLVAVHMTCGDAATFDAFLARNEGLLDRQLVAKHYSSTALSDPASRSGWVQPDLRPLPVLARPAG